MALEIYNGRIYTDEGETWLETPQALLSLSFFNGKTIKIRVPGKVINPVGPSQSELIYQKFDSDNLGFEVTDNQVRLIVKNGGLPCAC